ncbi:type I polyketide synthase, partial [Streptomyces sp. NPDC059922]|uniref:type I polyketide synthase n=1 Tax=Streptomyces sp. NPDC059922 TaxID=3347005 RepID=UPI003661CE86
HTLTRNNGTTTQLLRNLTTLHTHGHPTNWHHVFPGQTTAPIPGLPTYPFQHQHYWIEAAHSLANAGTIGLRTTSHPWLAAATALANDNGHLLTGRLSPAAHSWLNDHTVFDTTITPGTALLEIAFAAAREVGADAVGELTMTEPLVLRDAVRLQVVVGAEIEGRRAIALYSQPEDALDGVWHQHALGELVESASGAEGSAEFAELAQWPAPGAERVDLEGLYQQFASQGLGYGPAFQGLTELWRKDGHAYGLIRLPESIAPDDFGIHPALLDAALHGLTALRGTDEDVVLPFEWTDARLHATHSAELRVRISLDREAAVARIHAADGAGRPVASVGELRLREVTAEQIRAAEPVEHLYRADFVAPRGAARTAEVEDVVVLGGGVELAAVLGGVPRFADVDALLGADTVPARVLVDATAPTADGDPTGTAAQALTTLQRLLADERLAGSELVWVTRRAVGEGARDLVHAPLWGLVRAAATENPERSVRLIDLDVQDAHLLDDALALADEPEVAVRGGEVRVGRLVRARVTDTVPEVRRLDPEGVVLVTGGTGELGRQLAHHLVRHHDARHLVLTSRRGPEAPGADGLVGELRESGAVSVEIRACDIGDEREAAALIGGLDRPLTAVYHLAGVLDDGLVAGQSPERLARVFVPKVDGALHLHRLTQAHDLAAFVLFSSAAGILGSAGQSTYAAANTFLDALAHHRRAQGLPAASLAWGLWQLAGIGMTSHLGEAELSRIRRQGIGALTESQGMRLLDASLVQPYAHLAPIRLELASLQRGAGRGEEVAARFRGLVRARPRRAGDAQGAPSGLRERLVVLGEDERRDVLNQLVRTEAATVLGLNDPHTLTTDHVLKDLGIDSLMAVELR